MVEKRLLWLWELLMKRIVEHLSCRVCEMFTAVSNCSSDNELLNFAYTLPAWYNHHATHYKADEYQWYTKALVSTKH